MEGTYPVLHGDQPVGKARVTRRGLYYHFSCRLQLPGSCVYRLELSCGDAVEKLGVPVPEGDRFVLEKSIPISRFAAGKPTFRVIPKNESFQGRFVPISPEEPFAYLDRLKNAYLLRQGRQLGIVIRNERAEYVGKP